ncbi:MAG: hypothetical protein CR982_02455 [Candidatus Cloacimonadota bacterium]|nr:MAG: hypothetical protein CR982_02455 [Candidatus Cloacimonadota bacterium]PIE78535.1 MAG: hypothetical protein CSA15_07525 [Candidatus Delongbacteria bacterium]
MSKLPPLYTEEFDCKGCNKCIRECNTRAITYENNHARILQERCVFGGRCAIICPAQANKIRSDIDEVKDLLNSGAKVYVSLDQSYLSDFPNLDYKKLIKSIKRLGFEEVSETSIGMQELVAHMKDFMREKKEGVFLLSACPTTNMMIDKYHPNHSKRIFPFKSHFLTHAEILRKMYGDDIKVVYIGTCLSVKVESDENKELLNNTLTFKNLREWFKSENIDPYKEEIDNSLDFVPYKCSSNIEYTVSGGIKNELMRCGEFKNINFMKYSSVNNIKKALSGIDALSKRGSFFIEIFACPGGCIYGPGSRDESISVKEGEVVLHTSKNKYTNGYVKKLNSIIPRNIYKKVTLAKYDEKELSKALKTLGINSKEEEVDCAGCGFNTCREFAWALLDGMAKPTMCKTFSNKILVRLKIKDKDLKENLNLHQEIIDSVPIPIFYRKQDGTFLGCNRSYEDLRGKKREDIVGKSVYDLYQSNDAKLSNKMDKILMEDQVTQVYEHTVTKKEGDMHLLYNKGVYKDTDNKVAGIVGAILDITDRENFRIELEKAKELAELSVSLLKAIPAGIVMVDEDLKIIDSNHSFASIAGEEIEDLFEFNPGLKGADITKIVDFHKYFSSVFQNGENILKKDIKINGKIYEVSFYTISDQKVVGAVLLDMSNPSLRNEEVIERTEEVIKRNLDTVHKIAYLLGENAAKTEDMLGSIIEIYKSGK